MSNLEICFGPPGTGKTTKVLRAVEQLIKSGTSAEEIVYATFQKKAAEDAAARGGVMLDESRFKTLHGLCYGLLGVGRGGVVDSRSLRAFAKKVGVEFVFEHLSDEGDEVTAPSQESVDRKASRHIAAFNLSRQLCKTPAELDQVRQKAHPEIEMWNTGREINDYRTFIGKYEGWKKSEGLIDFTDMFELVLRQNVRVPAWKAVFLDECQDISPLGWSVFRKTLFDKPEVTMVGDDDQAVARFAGARVEEFLALRSEAKVTHLEQTHRFGPELVQFCATIAERLHVREPKTVRPKLGVINTISQTDKFDPWACSGETFLLHRHRIGCDGIAQWMIQAGKPFINERGINPLGRKEIAGYRAFAKLRKEGMVEQSDIQKILDVVPPFRDIAGKRHWMTNYHGKGKIQDKIRMGQQRFTSADLSTVMTSDFWVALSKNDWTVTNIAPPAYYEKLEAAGWSLGGRKHPDITITTIHGSKGREADHVYLFSEMMGKLRGEEDEHRVAYVGASRAKKSLTVVTESMAEVKGMVNYVYPSVIGAAQP